jgi:hypothetical protein
MLARARELTVGNRAGDRQAVARAGQLAAAAERAGGAVTRF